MQSFNEFETMRGDRGTYILDHTLLSADNVPVVEGVLGKVDFGYLLAL